MFCDSVCVQYYRKHTVTVTVTSLCKCRLLYPELFIEPGAGAGTAGTLLSAGALGEGGAGGEEAAGGRAAVVEEGEVLAGRGGGTGRVTVLRSLGCLGLQGGGGGDLAVTSVVPAGIGRGGLG